MHVEEQTLYGRWWHPKTPENKYFGFLEIARTGECTINIFLYDNQIAEDFFGIKKGNDIWEKIEPPRIVGHLNNGKCVTAEFHSIKRENIGFGLSITQHSSTVRICCHPIFICISSTDFGTNEMRFDNLHLKFDGIDRFIDGMVLESFHMLPSEIGPSLLTSLHQRQKTYKFYSNSEYELEAVSSYGLSGDLSKLSIDQLTKFKLSSEHPKPFTEWWDIVTGLNYFICTVFGQLSPLRSIHTSIESDQISIITFSDPLPENHHPIDCTVPLFQLIEDEVKIGKLIYHFIKLRNNYNLIFNNFFASKFTEKQYVAIRFFMIVSALEAFHREFQCKHYKENKCNNQERVGLKKRIAKLLERVDKISKYKRKWNGLPNTIASYRNQEAHILNVGHVRNVKNMEQLSRTLQAVFAILFLNEAAQKSGFTIPSDWINKHGWFFHDLPMKEEN